MMFQSTHSLRSATENPEAIESLIKVSIHALLAECDGNVPTFYNFVKSKFQSTHSLRSATYVEKLMYPYLDGFNPRTPCGVRPRYLLVTLSYKLVSIHALLAECDTMLKSSCTHIWTVSIHALLAECDRNRFSTSLCRGSFNPRTPCGVRQVLLHLSTTCRKFQSTHSLRSATDLAFRYKVVNRVSIHALLAECDCARPYTLLLNRANHTLRQPP